LNVHIGMTFVWQGVKGSFCDNALFKSLQEIMIFQKVQLD
jgi:hypothetical protein